MKIKYYSNILESISHTSIRVQCIKLRCFSLNKDKKVIFDYKSQNQDKYEIRNIKCESRKPIFIYIVNIFPNTSLKYNIFDFFNA